MIKYIFLLIILYYLLYQFKENFTNNKNSNTSIYCHKDIEIKENKSINSHIKQLNNNKLNNNILIPKFPLGYNIDNNKYNILNNYGIKYQKKRNEYLRTNNNNHLISFNTRKLFKKYDDTLNNTFLQIPNPLKNNKHNNKLIKYPKINLIYNDDSIYWSYNKDYLVDTYFRLFYETNYLNNKIDLNKFNKIRIDNKDIINDDFILTINN